MPVEYRCVRCGLPEPTAKALGCNNGPCPMEEVLPEKPQPWWVVVSIIFVVVGVFVLIF